MIRNYSQYEFLLESSFLKGSNNLGIIDLDLYDSKGILQLVSNYESDFIVDNNHLIFNFDNSELEDIINKEIFKQEVDHIFNLGFLNSTRVPIELDKFGFNNFPDLRVNHYLIKSNDSSSFILGDLESESINRFISQCKSYLNDMSLDISDRYCFITIDQKEVSKGSSQREFGWHIDGLQGDEVPEKKPCDFQFLWADETPTKFCTQEFNIKGLNLSINNAFNWLGRQVIDKFCYSLEKNRIYLMNTYHVHSATISDTKLYRRFIRLNFTYTPVTSVKMTINKEMKYNYNIGTTTGNIPDNLF